jgi:hypothetical protein
VCAIFRELVNIALSLCFFFSPPWWGKVADEIFRELVNIATFFLNFYFYFLVGKGSWCNIQRIGEYCLSLYFILAGAIFKELVNIANLTCSYMSLTLITCHTVIALNLSYCITKRIDYYNIIPNLQCTYLNPCPLLRTTT